MRIVGLYAVTPDVDDTALLVAKVTAAISGGATMVQYRHKSAAASLKLEQARALAAVCSGRALFIVNDDASLARAVAADGVHVGEDDGAVTQARAIVGAQRIVGVSCYNELARARRMAAEGADYLAFGSFYASSVKPLARHAALSLLHDARSLGLPLVAIGGITADNAGALVRAGADAVAVISALFDHDDPAAVTHAAAAIAAIFQSQTPPPGSP